jgi:hypothetical protein
LPIEMQERIVEQGVPWLFAGAAVLAACWLLVRAIRRRRLLREERERLIGRFERESVPAKRLELAFSLVELNDYRSDGLERVAPAMAPLFAHALATALGDKQHRIRGMAASYLGVIQDRSAVPFLLKALEDDHAYVRACAALALGRLRASEAKAKLETVMQEDWDQTVRSRAREALERLR